MHLAENSSLGTRVNDIMFGSLQLPLSWRFWTMFWLEPCLTWLSAVMSFLPLFAVYISRPRNVSKNWKVSWPEQYLSLIYSLTLLGIFCKVLKNFLSADYYYIYSYRCKTASTLTGRTTNGTSCLPFVTSHLRWYSKSLPEYKLNMTSFLTFIWLSSLHQ